MGTLTGTNLAILTRPAFARINADATKTYKIAPAKSVAITGA
jgi:hypothetical protein